MGPSSQGNELIYYQAQAVGGHLGFWEKRAPDTGAQDMCSLEKVSGHAEVSDRALPCEKRREVQMEGLCLSPEREAWRARCSNGAGGWPAPARLRKLGRPRHS